MFRRHTHEFLQSTAVARAHTHRVATTTGPAVHRNSTHIHNVRSYTSYDRQHTHRVLTNTGPAIHINRGLHYHKIGTRTSLD